MVHHNGGCAGFGGDGMTHHQRALQFWQNIADTSTDPDAVGEALDHVAIHRDAIKRGGWW